MYYATKTGSLVCSKTLVDGGANVNLSNAEGSTVLHAAAMSGNVELLRTMWTAPGRDIGVDDVSDAGTTLHFAVASRDVLVVKTLLGFGANPNGADKRGVPALCVAVASGATDVVTELLKAGGNIGGEAPGRVSALTIAADMASAGMLDAIVKHADSASLRKAADTRNGEGLYPAEVAAWSDRREIAAVLLPLTASLAVKGETLEGLLTRIAIKKKSDGGDDSQNNVDESAEALPTPPEASAVVRATKLKEEGNALFKAKNFSEAAKKYSDGLGVMPTHAVLLNNRANCYLNLGKLEDALADAESACKESPSWTKAFYRRGQCLMALKRFTDAAEVLWKAYQMDSIKSKAVLRLFNEAVALGKRKHQGKVEQVKGQDDAEVLTRKSEGTEMPRDVVEKEAAKEIKYDHVQPVEVPRNASNPDDVVTLPLAYNDDERPAEAAGRFVKTFNLDRSLVPRIAHYIQAKRDADAEDD